MLGKSRKIAISIAIATVLCFGAVAVACTTDETEKKYSVTYEAGYTGATEVIPAESYAEGATVTLRGADTYQRGGGIYS